MGFFAKLKTSELIALFVVALSSAILFATLSLVDTNKKLLNVTTPTEPTSTTFGRIGSDIWIKGTVETIERKPEEEGSGGVLRLSDGFGKEAIVIIPPRHAQCKSEGIRETFLSLVAGDQIELSGTMTGKSEISLCVSKNYYLKKLEK